MKTVIYARKSTIKDGQKETIENQIKICKRYANDNGLDVVEIKTDSATGTDDINRPEVKELIDDAIKGKYACVIMKGISRLYRDTEKGLGLIKKLDRSGIRVITVEEMFDSADNRTSTGKLDLSKITMYLMFSEMESKKLADRIKHTQIEKAHAGQWNQVSSLPMGYGYNSTTKKLEIDSAKSPTIKKVYELYLSGLGTKNVAFYLNGENEDGKLYLSPRGKRWSANTVNRILKNEVYIGHVIYNKRSKNERPYKTPQIYGKTVDDVYVGNDYNEKEKWIITEDAHPAIIDKETFRKVQEILETKAQRKGIKNNISLLANIAVCGRCGSGMTFKRGNKNAQGQIKSRDNYYCSNYIHYGNKYCNSHHVKAEDLESYIIVKLTNLLNDKKTLGRILSNNRSKMVSNDDKYIKQKEDVGKEIKKITDLMDKLLMKNLDGVIDDRQYSLMNSNYSERLNQFSNELVSIEIEMSNQSNSSENVEKFKRNLDLIINFENKPKEEQRYILLNLVHAMIVFEDKGIATFYNFNE